ncbi:hypothetical protein [Methanococcoides methylutens]|uniref:Uncharacterized protein n=1 Tax=Methanococcoides methylutens MM1 TaxID=1434104 RepID=A0A0E3ST12_METMT|nr:hypothetical protein [Methanococcoides methylutens]AKB85833.1 hypothetical protein MCMEM_1780 [Methanococcoides methylutens MM1]
MDKNINNNDLLVQLKQQLQEKGFLKDGVCEVCAETNPYALGIFEKHHLSTRAFPKETCVSCLNCHATVTGMQNSIPPKLRSRKIPMELRIPYIFLTHAALRKRMAEVEIVSMNQLYEVLKDGQYGIEGVHK